jgi:hypothetical protein
VPPKAPEGTINLSDPDSRVMRSKGLPHRQAYNVQTAVTEQQVILAAEISLEAADFGQLEPMLDQALAHLSRHGITEQPEAVVGDAGYWHTRQIEARSFRIFRRPATVAAVASTARRGPPAIPELWAPYNRRPPKGDRGFAASRLPDG